MYRIYSPATDRYLTLGPSDYHWTGPDEEPSVFSDLDHAHEINGIWGSPQSIVVELAPKMSHRPVTS